uniref:Uncharacterized protein n=1 Tax=Cacopsylla melanoneura TaxID=428564 RepID=A0A8D9B277_9HEMI
MPNLGLRRTKLRATSTALSATVLPSLLMYTLSLSFHRNSWKRVMLVYDKDGYKMLSGTHTCKLMMETLAEGLKKEKIHYANFDTEKNKGRSLRHNLKEEVGAMYGGKWELFLGVSECCIHRE